MFVIAVQCIPFIMQLQFYALSERRLGSGRGLSDVYYALDGQFVSLSSSCGRESANITYPLQNVQLYPSELQVLFFAMCAAALIGLSLIILSVESLLKNMNTQQLSTTSLYHY